MDDDRTPPEEGAVANLLRLAGPRPATPADVEARVRSAVHDRWRATIAARRRRRALIGIGGILAAAAAVLLVARIVPWPGRPGGMGPDPGPGPAPTVATLARVVGSLRTPEGREIGPGDPLSGGAVIVTGSRDRAALLLVEGTTLRLDHDTRLRLLPGPAIDLQAGALYADTGARASTAAPIEIRTPAGIVRDVGTRFEVRLQGEAVSVSVRQGLARLERDGRSHDAGGGSQIVATPGSEIRTRPVAIQGPHWDWILEAAPPFELDGATLAAFLAWVEREDGRPVRFTDPALQTRAATTILHGSAAGLRPDQALAAILPTCGLRHRIEGETFLIETAEQGAPPG